jgi:hypothetical protein
VDVDVVSGLQIERLDHRSREANGQAVAPLCDLHRCLKDLHEDTYIIPDPIDFDAAQLAIDAITAAVEGQLSPTQSTGYVALYEIEGGGGVNVLAIHHQLVDNYYRAVCTSLDHLQERTRPSPFVHSPINAQPSPGP